MENIAWAGSGKGEKVKARALGPGPAPSLFHPCLTQPKQYTADVMKSMMYFDPPLHILTSIRLHIWPSPYLT